MSIVERLTAAGVSPAAILLVGLFLVLFLLLIIVTRGRVLRIFRIFFKRAKFLRSTQRVGGRARSYVGTSGFAAFKRMFRPLTETERALIETKAMAKSTREAIKFAIEKYNAQPERDLNINEVLSDFDNKETELWTAHRSRIFHNEREIFFNKYRSEIRRQIGDPNAEFNDVDFDTLDYDQFDEYIDEPQILYDSHDVFKEQEDKLSEHGIYFKELAARAGYVDLREEFELEQAQRHYLLASKFFKYDIPVESNEDLLFEDINDSMVVRMMGNVDNNVFYFLTEMRKMINRNVRLLSTLIAVFVGVFVVANYWSPSIIDYFQEGVRQTAAAPEGAGFFETLQVRMTSAQFTDELISRWAFALASFVIAITLVGFYYRNPYTHYQSQNRVHLINLMTSYSALLVSNYKKAESNSRGSFSGDQSGPSAREHAKIWFLNMQWIAFRLFCVEMFLRSIIFQIKRNSGYYIAGMPLLILPLGIFLTCWLPDMILNHQGDSAPATFNAATIEFIEWFALNFAFIVLLFILVWNVCWRGCLTGCVRKVLDIQDESWQNFHNLDLQRTTAGLVRHFIAEIYNERHRVRGGGYTGGGV